MLKLLNDHTKIIIEIKYQLFANHAEDTTNIALQVLIKGQ